MNDTKVNGRAKGSGRSVALWAALATLFTQLAAINMLAWIGDETKVVYQALAAIITAIASAGAVYAKVRLDDEKTRQKGAREDG